MSRARMLAVAAILSTAFWAGCGKADPEATSPTTAQANAPPPPVPEAPPVAGTQRSPDALAPDSAESKTVEPPAIERPAVQSDVAQGKAEETKLVEGATAAADEAKPQEPGGMKISEEVQPLMRKIVRRQRTRLWELKQKPERLDDPNAWQTVTKAAEQLAEVAGQLEPLAPRDSQVWKDSIARLRRGTTALRKAAGDQSVNHFKGAIQTTWRACNNCHAKYAPKAPMNKLEYASAR